jgi:hypothetical protein
MKWAGRKTNHSLPSRVDVEKAWNFTLTPPYISVAPLSMEHSYSFIFVGFEDLQTPKIKITVYDDVCLADFYRSASSIRRIKSNNLQFNFTFHVFKCFSFKLFQFRIFGEGGS